MLWFAIAAFGIVECACLSKSQIRCMLYIPRIKYIPDIYWWCSNCDCYCCWSLAPPLRFMVGLKFQESRVYWTGYKRLPAVRIRIFYQHHLW